MPTSCIFLCGEAGDKVPLSKLVYQPGVQWNAAREEKTVTCVFGVCELPTAKYRFAVTPLNSLGMRGRTLYLGLPGTLSRGI